MVFGAGIAVVVSVAPNINPDDPLVLFLLLLVTLKYSVFWPTTRDDNTSSPVSEKTEVVFHM